MVKLMMFTMKEFNKNVHVMFKYKAVTLFAKVMQVVFYYVKLV